MKKSSINKNFVYGVTSKVNMSKSMDTVLEAESIEIPNSGGARKSKLVSKIDTICFPYEDATTMWEALHRGLRLSGNGRCIGWRDGNSDYNWITYNSLIERAQNFGSGLVNIGMKPGQTTTVGIYAQNSVEWLVAEFGCCSQSMIIVPFHNNLDSESCYYMVKQAEIQTIICDQEVKARNILTLNGVMPSLKQIVVVEEMSLETIQLAKGKNMQLHSFKDIEAMGNKKPVPNLIPHFLDIFLVCYTSGTTGDPKGVLLTHQNVISSASACNLYAEGLCLTKNDTSISYLPLAHLFEHVIQGIVFMIGGSVGIFRGDITSLTEDIKILQPTILPAVPRVLNRIYSKAQALLHTNGYSNQEIVHQDESVQSYMERENVTSSVYEDIRHSLGGKLRVVLTGAAPISEDVKYFCRFGLRCEVLEVYGQTESGGPATMYLSKENSSNDGAGAPLSCCIIKLVDVPEDGYFAEKGHGEICIKGYNVFRGYLKDTRKTAETVDKAGWLHTGDIGTWLPNGVLKIEDRKKNIFKLSQGEFVAPEKIANIYSASPFISQIFIDGDCYQSYLVGIVIPEKEVILPWSRKNINVDTWEEVCKNLDVKQLILDDMNRLGKSAGLRAFEQVKDIYLHQYPLTLETGHLTPTMKAKRNICRQFFKNEIEALYRCKDQCVSGSK